MSIDQPARTVETFRMVPDRLWADDRLEPGDVRIWCCLSFLARGRDYTDATDATLAEKLGANERTVRLFSLRFGETKTPASGPQGRATSRPSSRSPSG